MTEDKPILKKKNYDVQQRFITVDLVENKNSFHEKSFFFMIMEENRGDLSFWIRV